MKPLLSGLVAVFFILFLGCEINSERQDQVVVNDQQTHYQKTQPIPFFDYSLPRDVYGQIYKAVASGKFRATYTIITSWNGDLFFEGPSISFGIPADTQLTNPLQSLRYNGSVIEQAEPNGLFSSKNTDGTWVLFVDPDSGTTYPLYTELKVSTFPFPVKQVESSKAWVKAGTMKPVFEIDLSGIKTE